MTFINNASSFIQDQLNSFLGLSSAVDSTGAPRNAMVFTSRLRQIASGRANTVSALGSVGDTSDFSGDVFNQTFFKNAHSIMPSIAMRVNPKSIRFKQPKRFSEKKKFNGSQFYHFTNSKGQNNDILRIEFKGNTGNIDRRGSIDATSPPGTPPANDTGAIAKLLAWHNLYLLTREPMLLEDGTENTFTISYISPLIPVVVDFTGFFAEILEFEETGEKPNSRDYSMQFVVTATMPDLDDLLDDIQLVLAATQAQPSFNGQLLGTTTEGNGIAANLSLNNL